MLSSVLHPSVPALAASLANDPFYLAITADFARDAQGRRAVLSQYLDYSLREAQRSGQCTLLQDERLGAALWTLPRPAEAEAADAQAKVDYLQAVLGPRGMDNYRQIIAFMGPRASGMGLEGAWYLSILGIAPASQGQGLGARLLAPTLAAADQAGVACYLETFSARNEGFYERAGFGSLASHLEPMTGKPYTIMVRNAGDASSALPTAG